VVFLGAESTGKSTLTSHMAEHLDTAFVREYGRDHYAERDGKLTLDDYVTIARTHQQMEDSCLMEARGVLFIDTNALTTLFYSYYYNGGALPELHDIADRCVNRYDLTFVCDADIPFEQDGWRDNALLREKSHRMVLMDLNTRRVRYRLVSGSKDQRRAAVLAALAGPPIA
jgi:NadR type nicotinamide-nucleotide adenylyltransferase